MRTFVRIPYILRRDGFLAPGAWPLNFRDYCGGMASTSGAARLVIGQGKADSGVLPSQHFFLHIYTRDIAASP